MKPPSKWDATVWILVVSCVVVLISCIVITFCYCRERNHRKKLEKSRQRKLTKSGRFATKSKSASVFVTWESVGASRNSGNRASNRLGNGRISPRSSNESSDLPTVWRKSGLNVKNWSSTNSSLLEMTADVSSTHDLAKDRNPEKLPDRKLRIKDLKKENSMQLQWKNEIDFKELVFKGAIAHGSFGSVVYCGEWKDIPVAIKLSNKLWEEMTDEEKHTFKRETKLSINCSNHKNIVRVYGYTLKPKISVVMELCQGSIDKVMQKITLSFKHKLNILVGSLKGLSFLHDLNIIHRDLAARNILIDSNLEAKICDFGMSRMTKSRHITKVLYGPAKWMSPESLQEQETSKESDVYAWGITAWEILMGEEPYPGLSPIQVMLNVVKNPNFRPSLDGIPTDLRDLLSRCWHHEPENRPKSKDALEELKHIRRKLLQIPSVSQWDSLSVLSRNDSGNSANLSYSRRNFSRDTAKDKYTCPDGNFTRNKLTSNPSSMRMPRTQKVGLEYGNKNHVYSTAPALLENLDEKREVDL